MGTVRAIEGLILLVLRLALGGIFVYAAWVKLDNPQAFADSIKGFKLLPPEGDHLVTLATFAVPWVEALAGAVLILGLWSRAAALVLLVNLFAFITAIASVLERGISTKCGCFGKFSPFCPETITSCNIIQNAVLAAVAFIILLRGPGLLSIDRKPKCRRPAPISSSAPSPAPAPRPAAPVAAPARPAAPAPIAPKAPATKPASPKPAPTPRPPTSPPQPRPKQP